MEPYRDIIWLPGTKLSAKEIIRTVAAKHGLTTDDLTGPARFKTIAHARQEAMWELRLRTKLSTTQIGQRLGDRDHTTVLHGLRAHERRLSEAQEKAA